MDAPSPPSWQDTLANEKEKPYFQHLMHFVTSERAAGKTIYPAQSQVFNALTKTPLASLKLVILGQDPYHGPNQAHGLSFSVQPGTRTPPSLQNIFKELHADIGFTPPQHGCLETWAEQGVLLLNTVLTVEAGKAHSHAKQGWEQFTDRVIAIINESQKNIVFLLWGAHAQQKSSMIDPLKHLVLKSAHPSPLSAHRGFLGCRHFSKANDYLVKHGKKAIDWQLS